MKRIRIRAVAVIAMAIASAAGISRAQNPPAPHTPAPPAPAAPAAPAAPSIKDRVAALKQTMASDHANLAKYEWIETTAVSLKGDEKSHKQARCYHGADGKVQKVAINPEEAAKRSGGIRGKIKERKKEELSDYMKKAVELVKGYVPPDAAKIQKAMDAGKVSFTPDTPAGRVRIDIHDYEKAGDKLTLEVDQKSSRITKIDVNTYLDDAKDAVTLVIAFKQLEDGTGYPATIELEAKAKNIKVDVENAGYLRIAAK